MTITDRARLMDEPLTPPTPEQIEAAHRAVVRAALDAADRDLLLAMLGVAA